MHPRLLAVLALSGFAATAAIAAEPRSSSAEDEVSEATRLVERGAFEDSVAHWKKAIARFEKAKNPSASVDAQIRLAAVYHSLGQVRLATETLLHAQEQAGGDEKQLARIKCGLGASYMFSPPPMEEHSEHMEHAAMHQSEDVAEKTLKESIQLARAARDPRTEAAALNNLANLYSYRRQPNDAVKQYQLAISTAANAGEKELESQACVNLARAALDSGDFDNAKTWNDRAIEKAGKLRDSHEKAYRLLAAGRTYNDLFAAAPDHDNKLRLRAFEAFQKAMSIGEAIGDKRAVSFAGGYQGGLYETENKYGEALVLTRKAVALAQETKSPDALYRWQWQTGRLLHAQHDDEAAIAACRRAVDTLQSIRHDVSLRYGNPNAHSSFRDVAGGLYFLLADLLLQRADSIHDPAALEKTLREARDAAEQLKSAELEDYFQDQCVNLLKSKIAQVEAISGNAAVVYIIPLPDRTELLVSLPSGLHRVKSPVNNTTLENVAHQFRINLEKRTTYEYLAQGKQLYEWLIKPLEPLLADSPVDTLVFIPDGALRNIPMAALFDGKKYLVEKFAIAVTPGLTLMEPRPFKKDHIVLVANGLSDGVQGYAPLNYVPEEVNNLRKLFGGTQLMNQQFVKPNVQKEFSQENNYSIVHIASHGHFDSNAKKTYVLTFDSKLTLDELEALIRPAQLRDKPVEMLTLSACQTAAGDDRAALGLAGVAIKAGARSAFATLWFVNDESSSLLVSNFYTQLSDHPDISKAKALQAAQMKILADQRYAHPCYWAPYLIIGNWL